MKPLKRPLVEVTYINGHKQVMTLAKLMAGYPELDMSCPQETSDNEILNVRHI